MQINVKSEVPCVLVILKKKKKFTILISIFIILFRYLKQLRRNRDAENELMKNVKGWKTGTFYGEPVYKTVGEERIIDPGLNEYYVHSDPKTLHNRAYWHKYL